MGNINPLRDIEIINLELILADLETVTKRKNNIIREVKKGDKEALIENKALEKLKKVLETGELANKVYFDKKEMIKIKMLNLLTLKPFIYGLNKQAGSSNLDKSNPTEFKKLIEYIENMGSRYVIIDAKIEEELKDFDGEEKEIFRRELGGEDDGINNLIKESYKLLGLENYFTTGVDETRAWAIKKGSTAPEAGLAIHSDFKEKFIRAEVIWWKDLLELGSYSEARAHGKIRTEGKDYVVKRWRYYRI